MKFSFRAIIFLFSMMLPFLVDAQRAIPPHEGKWVHDEANVLSASTIGQLEQVLKLSAIHLRITWLYLLSIH